MDSYVIHIYRRETATADERHQRLTDRHQLIGLLELVEQERRLPFRSMEELWALLNEEGDLIL